MTNEEYARVAALHGFGTDDSPRQTLNKQTGQTRQQEWAQAGIRNFSDAEALVKELRTASDTKCFVGLDGREMYANDRLNVIHRANNKISEKSTAYINNDPDLSATERLQIWAREERREAKDRKIDAPCIIREGGSPALANDREQQVFRDRQAARASFSEAMQERMSKDFGGRSTPPGHTPKHDAEQSLADELSLFLKAGLDARDKAAQERGSEQGHVQNAARSGDNDLDAFLTAGMTARERAEHDQKHGSDRSASARRDRSDDLADFLSAGISAEQRDAVERSASEQSRKDREQERKHDLKGTFGRSQQ